MRFLGQSGTIGARPRTRVEHNNISDLAAAVGRIPVVSTDVFDTLLVRSGRSERARIIRGERLFSDLLARRGSSLAADVLIEARLQAQRLAFRGLSLRGVSGEARLEDIVGRQLSVLGLSPSLVAERLRIELQVEKESLFANRRLASVLRAHRRAGARIVAVSDTTLPGEGVEELIRHFHGTELVDRVYSSADHGSTKREGGLFLAVAKSEKVALREIAHIGDDLLADVERPSSKGVAAHYAPVGAYRRYLRSASGVLAEVRRSARNGARAARAAAPFHEDAISFGREVFGPIVAQFCLRVWMYAAEAEAGGAPRLLFCARGGVGIREAFERLTTKLSLPLRAPRENISISRLVAARGALLAQSRCALEELDREFRGSAFADVAAALGGRAYALPVEWRAPFRASAFVALLHGGSGAEALADIERQHALFTRHFKALAGDSERIILCDTGLYGSTQRLLSSAFPALALETVQFARANYKGHGEEHFPRVTGLMVERNRYSPFDLSSCVLRYWHLIEKLFEPAVPSVRLFFEDERGRVRANCGDISFGAVDPSVNNPLLTGALSYIDSLPKDGGAVVLSDAEIAWRRLKRAIVWPGDADLRRLGVGARSVDFGRPDAREVLAPRQKKTFARLCASLKAQLWREGVIARDFPLSKHILLPALETVHSLRGLSLLRH
jgi:FMN phosphatase YigB (HAD superfamily)